MASDTPPEAAFGTPPEAAFGTPPRIERLPPIRRARGFRLYDVAGRRYLDLYREGALLGHRGEGTLTVMKSVLSQGLAVALPSIWERRIRMAIARRFPDCAEVRVYSSLARALRAAECFVGSDAPAAVHDPALDGEGAGTLPVAFWRPFLDAPRAHALILRLPVTVLGAPVPVCFDREPPRSVPFSDPVPGFALAAALRGFLSGSAAGGSLARFPIDAALERAVDSAPGWARTGLYVRARFEESDYPGVHDEFLQEGVLLAPTWPGPSVLPSECSAGEVRRLAELFTRIPGG